MLHIPALWYFDTSVTYPRWFRRVKFVVIPPRFVLQQYLWNIVIQPTVGCYNSWANLRCSSCSPLEEKSLWTGTIIVDYSDVVRASPVGAAPSTSSFSTWHRASMDLGKYNCNTRWETFKFGDLVRLKSEVWRYLKLYSILPGPTS